MQLHRLFYSLNLLSPGFKAVNTWVEDVGEGKFTACAMKSGRLEHDGPVPSDYGLASVDWVAFQGATRGGMVGTEPIDDWWEGTTCKLVMLPPVRRLVWF